MLIASLKPGKPSTLNINTSLTPLFFKSVSIEYQNLEVSLSPIHIPNISLKPSLLTPKITYAALFFILESYFTL